MYLNPLTDKIEVVLGAPATTSQLSWNVSYHDITYLNVSLPRIGSAGSTNGTTPVAIIPINTSSSVTRQVIHINVYNSDTATKSVIIQKDVKGVKYVLLRYDLTVGDTLMWSLEDGWRLMSEYAGSGGIISLNSLAATIQGFATGTAGTDFNINSFSSTHTFNLPAASATNTGKLTSGDWVTFNSKEPAIPLGTTSQYWRGDKSWQTLNTAAVLESTNLYFTNARARQAISLTTTGTSGAATYDNVTGILNVPQYQGAFSTGNLTESTSSVLTITGGTGAVIGSGTTIQVLQAGASQSGFLSSSDWSTFNSKEPSLTKGNLTEATSSILTISNGTNAVIGTGTSIQVKQSSSTQDGFLSSTDWTTFNNKLSSNQTITLSADVTGSGTTSIATTIANAAVTLSKMANLAANSIIGNNTGSSATPVALTQADVTAMLNLFNSTLKGLVPASGGGTTNFLRADGTWAVPAGGGGGGITAGESIAYAIALG